MDHKGHATRLVPLATGAVCLVLGLAASSDASEVVVGGTAESVSIRAVEAPLSELLASVVALVPDSTLYIDPEFEQMLVTAEIERLPLFDAVGQIMQELDVDFAIVGGSGGHALRLYAGALDDVVPYRGPTDSVVPLEEDGSTNAEALIARQERRAQRELDAASAEELDDGLPPTVDTPGASDRLVTKDFTMVGESVTYHDPNFVPYKLSEAAKKARQSIDLSKIP